MRQEPPIEVPALIDASPNVMTEVFMDCKPDFGMASRL